MKRVLFVTYSFPPLLQPESIQTARYVKFLLQHGWESSVLTVDGNSSVVEKDDSMLRMVPPNVVIEREKSFEPATFIKICSKLLPFLVSMPDSKIGWYPFVYRKAVSMLKRNKFDLIHSWACYFTSNLVGLKLKKQTGLPWVAHFSDPWVDSPYYHYGKIDGYVNRKLERLVMENADALVFVSEETRQLVMKKYPTEWLSKAYVIPHCYDSEPISTFKKRKNSKLTFTYTGNFYRNIRTPISLFKAVRNILSKQPDIHKFIDIQIIGTLSNDYRNMVSELRIDKMISVIGAVPYLKSLEYILNADVLLLIDAPSDGPSVFLPSKLIEYIGSGNPVLGISPLNGTSANLIKKVNGIVVEPNNVEGIEKAILTLYEKYQDGRLSDYSYSPEDTAMYDAKNATRQLAELFEMVSR